MDVLTFTRQSMRREHSPVHAEPLVALCPRALAAAICFPLGGVGTKHSSGLGLGVGEGTVGGLALWKPPCNVIVLENPHTTLERGNGKEP